MDGRKSSHRTAKWAARGPGAHGSPLPDPCPGLFTHTHTPPPGPASGPSKRPPLAAPPAQLVYKLLRERFEVPSSSALPPTVLGSGTSDSVPLALLPGGWQGTPRSPTPGGQRRAQLPLPTNPGLCRMEMGWMGLKEARVLTSSQKRPTAVGGQRGHGPVTPSRMGSRPTLGAAGQKSPRTVNSG